MHRALAEATDPDSIRSPRLAPGPRDARSGRGRRRGAPALSGPGASTRRLAAAAAFLERAARLTPEPARRAQRELTAAQAKHDAGAPDQALALLAAPKRAAQRAAACSAGAAARAARLRSETRKRRAPLLLRAAQRLEPLDAGLARETYLEALAAAVFAGRLSRGAGVLDG